jgi:hypothetical protein
MQSRPYLPNQYNLDNLIYDDIEGSEDKLIVKIYDGKKGKPIYIQTPELTNLFGATKKSNYYELLLPLGGISCLIFKNFMTSLQNKVLADANVNKTNWFKNRKSVKFSPLIKEVNKDVTSTMDQTEDLDKCDEGMIKIKVTNGTIIKKNHEEINAKELSTGKKLRMIIQIYAIWITTVNDTTTFGIYIKPEIIEEKNSYNLEFIDEKVIFDSDSDSDSTSSTPTCNSAKSPISVEDGNSAKSSNSSKSNDEEIKYESK